MDRFFTRLNPLIAAVLRSPLHGLLSPGLMLITVAGRKTGRRYTFPVGYQRRGDTLTVMVSEARRKSWWRNFREPGQVELRIRGQQREGRARLIAPDSEEFRTSCERTLQRMPWLAKVFKVADYDRRQGLSAAQLAGLREEIAAVRIELPAAAD